MATLSENLTRIKDATDSIRNIVGLPNDSIEDVATAVEELESQKEDLEQQIQDITPVGTINIGANGLYDVAHYANADVALDEDAVLNNYFDINLENSYNWSDVQKQPITFHANNYPYLHDMFNGCPWPSIIVEGTFDSSVTDISGMFAGTSRAERIRIPSIDSQNITNCSAMFNASRVIASDMQNIINDLNTSSITNIGDMFGSWAGTGVLDVSNFDTGLVEHMNGVFGWTSNNGDNHIITGYENWNVSNCRNFSYVFMNTWFNNLNNYETNMVLDLSTWASDNVVEIYAGFAENHYLQKLYIPYLNFASEKLEDWWYFTCSNLLTWDARLMLADCRSLDFSRADDISEMFSGLKPYCCIIVKNDTEKQYILDNYPELQQVYTVEEYEENNNLYTTISLYLEDNEGNSWANVDRENVYYWIYIEDESNPGNWIDCWQGTELHYYEDGDTIILPYGRNYRIQVYAEGDENIVDFSTNDLNQDLWVQVPAPVSYGELSIDVRDDGGNVIDNYDLCYHISDQTTGDSWDELYDGTNPRTWPELCENGHDYLVWVECPGYDPSDERTFTMDGSENIDFVLYPEAPMSYSIHITASDSATGSSLAGEEVYYELQNDMGETLDNYSNEDGEGFFDYDEGRYDDYSYLRVLVQRTAYGTEAWTENIAINSDWDEEVFLDGAQPSLVNFEISFDSLNDASKNVILCACDEEGNIDYDMNQGETTGDHIILECEATNLTDEGYYVASVQVFGNEYKSEVIQYHEGETEYSMNIDFDPVTYTINLLDNNTHEAISEDNLIVGRCAVRINPTTVVKYPQTATWTFVLPSNLERCECYTSGVYGYEDYNGYLHPLDLTLGTEFDMSLTPLSIDPSTVVGVRISPVLEDGTYVELNTSEWRSIRGILESDPSVTYGVMGRSGTPGQPYDYDLGDTSQVWAPCQAALSDSITITLTTQYGTINETYALSDYYEGHRAHIVVVINPANKVYVKLYDKDGNITTSAISNVTDIQYHYMNGQGGPVYLNSTTPDRQGRYSMNVELNRTGWFSTPSNDNWAVWNAAETQTINTYAYGITSNNAVLKINKWEDSDVTINDMQDSDVLTITSVQERSVTDDPYYNEHPYGCFRFRFESESDGRFYKFFHFKDASDNELTIDFADTSRGVWYRPNIISVDMGDDGEGHITGEIQIQTPINTDHIDIYSASLIRAEDTEYNNEEIPYLEINSGEGEVVLTHNNQFCFIGDLVNNNWQEEEFTPHVTCTVEFDNGEEMTIIDNQTLARGDFFPIDWTNNGMMYNYPVGAMGIVKINITSDYPDTEWEEVTIDELPVTRTADERAMNAFGRLYINKELGDTVDLRGSLLDTKHHIGDYTDINQLFTIADWDRIGTGDDGNTIPIISCDGEYLTIENN